MASFQVVYLTGAPASGKSTLAKALRDAVQIEVWDYGQRLLDGALQQRGITYESLRGNSAGLITADDVARTDDALIAWTEERRLVSHLLIDTHAVTKEAFGFRVTPFSAEQVLRLKPTLLVGLYVDPEVARARIAADAAGRLTPTPFEAGLHSALQASVLAHYSVLVGKPVYLLDGAKPTSELVAIIQRKLSA